jgi:hypothetical protein
MPDLSTTAIGPFLSALRALPVWALAGLALAGYAVLFAPAFGGVDAATFRAQWGVVIWIEALAFSMLTVARALEVSVTSYLSHRKAAHARRALRLVPRHQQCWWHLAKQRDDSFVSQISLDVEAANLTDRPVRIVKARLIRPRMKGELIHGEVMLPKAGSPYHSHKHAVPPHDTVTASLHIMVRGAITAQGKPIRATIGIIDHFGDEYRLKRILIPTHDPPLPRLPFFARLASRLKQLPGLPSATRQKLNDAFVQPPEWQHLGQFDEVDLILNEERRNYAACGRIRGGLGSLNVGLQSEPNFGWTTVGSAPALLWDKAQAKPVESQNALRLIRLHDALDSAGKDHLERYLLSHLDKRSPFADVGYFLFLALHRMGRTVDALQAARLRLAGDKVDGYSNLLGTLSAIVSHEHFDIDPALYPRISEVLAGDPEYNFRLSDKITLARLQQIDDSESKAAASRQGNGAC